MAVDGSRGHGNRSNVFLVAVVVIETWTFDLHEEILAIDQRSPFEFPNREEMKCIRHASELDLHRLIQLFEYRCEAFQNLVGEFMVDHRGQREQDEHDQVGDVEAIDFHAHVRREKTDEHDHDRVFRLISGFNTIELVMGLPKVPIRLENELRQGGEILFVVCRRCRRSLLEEVQEMKSE